MGVRGKKTKSVENSFFKSSSQRSSHFLSHPPNFPPRQSEAGEGTKGEESTAGSDQDGGIRRRGGHGEGEEDLSAANVRGGGISASQNTSARHLSHTRGGLGPARTGGLPLGDSVFLSAVDCAVPGARRIPCQG